MKKLFSALALMTVLLMAGGAWGQVVPSVIDIAAVPPVNDNGSLCSNVDTDVDGEPSGPYVLGKEYLAELSQAQKLIVDLGSARKRACDEPVYDRSNIVYKSGCDIDFGTIIELTIVNGEIAPNPNYGLYDCEKKAKVADLVDFRVGPLGGYTKMYFEYDTLPELYPGAVVPAGTPLNLTEDGLEPKKANRPTLWFTPAGLQNGPMTIAVTEAQDDGGRLLLCPLADPEVLVKVYADAQVKAQVDYRTAGTCVTSLGYATSTIDVFSNPSRSKFKDEGYPFRDTNKDKSVAEIRVFDAGQLGPINEGICLTSSQVGFKLELLGNQDAIIGGSSTPGIAYDGVKLGGFVSGTSNYKLTQLTTKWSITSNFNNIDLRNCKTDDLLITVNGSTPMQTAVYPVYLEYTSQRGGTTYTYVLLDGVSAASTAFVWDVNAIKARVAYIVIGQDPSFTSFVSIGNRAGYPAEVWVEGVVSDFGNLINTAVTGKLTPPLIPSTGVSNFNNTTLLAALRDKNGQPLAADQGWKADLTFYIAVDKDMADVSAQLRNGTGGRTILHVLYNTGNPLDFWRNWQ